MSHFSRQRERADGRAPRAWRDLSAHVARYREVLVSAASAACVFTVVVLSRPLPPVHHDALGYTMTALRLVRDGVFAYSVRPPGSFVPPNAIVTPAYVLFLAAFYAFAGAADVATAIVRTQPFIVAAQVVLAVGAVAAISATGRLLGGRRLALATGLLAALYLPFAWTATVALSEGLGTFLSACQMLAAVALCADGARRTYTRIALFGALSAATVMVRPVMALWIVVPFAYLLLRRLEPLRRGTLLTLAALLAFSAVLAPWWVRNAVVTGGFVPLRTDAGTPMFRSTGGLPLTAQEQVIFAQATSRGQDALGAVAMERIRTGLARDPAAFLGWRLEMAYRGVTTPFNAQADALVEAGPDAGSERIDIVPAAGTSDGILITLGRFSTGVQWCVLGLALAGALFLWRSPGLALIASIPLYVLAVHFLTWFLNRYFLPAMPAMIVLAGAAGLALWRAAVTRVETLR